MTIAEAAELMLLQNKTKLIILTDHGLKVELFVGTTPFGNRVIGERVLDYGDSHGLIRFELSGDVFTDSYFDGWYLEGGYEVARPVKEPQVYDGSNVIPFKRV